MTNSGRAAEARPIFEEALRRFRASGDRWYEALALGSLAWSAFGAGDPRIAIDFYMQSMVLGQSLGDRATTAISLETGAIAAIELDEPVVAATLLGALDTAIVQYGVRPPAGLALLLSTRDPRDRVRESLDEATLARATAEGSRMSLDEAVDLIVETARKAGLGPPAPTESAG